MQKFKTGDLVKIPDFGEPTDIGIVIHCNTYREGICYYTKNYTVYNIILQKYECWNEHSMLRFEEESR